MFELAWLDACGCLPGTDGGLLVSLRTTWYRIQLRSCCTVVPLPTQRDPYRTVARRAVCTVTTYDCVPYRTCCHRLVLFAVRGNKRGNSKIIVSYRTIFLQVVRYFYKYEYVLCRGKHGFKTNLSPKPVLFPFTSSFFTSDD